MSKVYTNNVIDEDGDITGQVGTIIANARELEYVESDLHGLHVGQVTSVSKYSTSGRILRLHGKEYQKTYVHYKDAPFPFLVWERIS